VELKERRAQALAAGRWWQCRRCKQHYQAQEKLSMCPACQAKVDLAEENKRAWGEAQKSLGGG
jgi:Zn finger protein HypA/HybF involved in hydrogenase expression